MATTPSIGLIETAKEVRIFLKKSGIKALSVRTSRFANGNSIDIDVTKQVYDSKPVEFWRDLQRFTYGQFNGMIDSYDPNNSIIETSDGRKVSPGAKYLSVHVRREA